MKAFLLIVILLLLSAWIGLQIHQGNGVIILHYGSWSLETSLWVALLVTLLAFILFYIILRLIQKTQLWPRRLRGWGRKRKKEKMLNIAHQGVQELIEAKWDDAEQHLIKSVEESPLALVNYWGAALAANQQQSWIKRDDYLQKITEKNLLTPLQMYLLQAKLDIKSNQWERAASTLQDLAKNYPKHPQVLLLLIDVYQHQQNWLALQPLLLIVAKQGLLPEEKLQQLFLETYRAQFNAAVKANEVEPLNSFWKQVSVELQPQLIVNYVDALLQLKQDQQAMLLIERYLKQQWNTSLLSYYAEITSKDLSKQLIYAESWLSKHPESPELLYCLGILSKRCQLWGKAKDYLSAAIKMQPTPKGCQALAQVFESLNETSQALSYYRQGLSLVR